MMRSKLISEFVGTFALVFIGAGAAAVGSGGLVGVALAHGLVLMGVIYAFGGLSGAHVNPAVSFGLWLRGQLDLGELVRYWMAQLLGGIAAGFGLRLGLGGPVGALGATVLAADVNVLQGFFIELVLTALLATAVFRAAVRGHAGNLAGVAIGATLSALILFGGPLTGASLNPARTLGPALAASEYSHLWLYLAAPAAGGALAAGLDWLFEQG